MKTPFVLLLAACSTFATIPAWSQQALLFTHAVVIDGNGGPVLEDWSVLVQGERIVAMGPSAAIAATPGARVIDLNGKTLLPGLADMHVHLIGGWDGELRWDLLNYRRYLNSLLYAGVTTVLDTGNVLPYVLQLRQEIAAGRLLGPRIYCAGPVIDGSDPVWPSDSIVVSSLAQIPEIVRQQKAAGVDILKGYAGLSIPMVIVLAEEGKKAGLPLFVDQWSRNGSEDLMMAGITAFAHTPVRDMDEAAIALMKARDIRVITTLTVYEPFERRRLVDPSFLDDPLIRDTTPPFFLDELRSLTEPEEIDPALDRLEPGKVNTKKLFDAGILLAAGTDAPGPGFLGEGIHRELELLVEAGLTPLQALTLATSNAARLMNAAAEWGTVAPGLVANLLIVDGRPDHNIADTRRVAMVVLRGKILDRDKLRFDPVADPGLRPSAVVLLNQGRAARPKPSRNPTFAEVASVNIVNRLNLVRKRPVIWNRRASGVDLRLRANQDRYEDELR